MLQRRPHIPIRRSIRHRPRGRCRDNGSAAARRTGRARFSSCTGRDRQASLFLISAGLPGRAWGVLIHLPSMQTHNRESLITCILFKRIRLITCEGSTFVPASRGMFGLHAQLCVALAMNDDVRLLGSSLLMIAIYHGNSYLTRRKRFTGTSPV